METPLAPDWTHLPDEIDPTSLWDVLHDARLVSCRSDRLACTVEMAFTNSHLQSFHKLSDGSLFTLKFAGVSSARVAAYSPWPGDFEVPRDVPREEQSRLIAEYHAKWRMESKSWDKFEDGVNVDGVDLDVSTAALAQTDTATGFKLTGMLDGETYHEVFIAAAGVEYSTTDLGRISLEEFSKLGEAYWEDFASRRRTDD